MERLHGRVFELIRTSFVRRYERVSMIGLTWTSVWINTDEYRKKIQTSIKEKITWTSIWINMDEYRNKIQTNIKEKITRTSVWINMDDYRKNIQTSIKERFNTNKCLNEYGWVCTSIKERFNANECLNQYRRVSKEATHKHQRKV